jgi:hypothetical protein
MFTRGLTAVIRTRSLGHGHVYLWPVAVIPMSASKHGGRRAAELRGNIRQANTMRDDGTALRPGVSLRIGASGLLQY